MTPSVTALYAGLSGLLLLALAARVVARRRGARIGIGTGDDRELERRVRAHGNAVEYLPLGLVLLLVAELAGLGAAWLHAAGVALVASRVAHAYGLSRSAGTSPGRFVGTLGTWLVILALSLWLVARGAGLA
jgi:uncharacterized membrane protein YecN with MAPEG domain